MMFITLFKSAYIFYETRHVTPDVWQLLPPMDTLTPQEAQVRFLTFRKEKIPTIDTSIHALTNKGLLLTC